MVTTSTTLKYSSLSFSRDDHFKNEVILLYPYYYINFNAIPTVKPQQSPPKPLPPPLMALQASLGLGCFFPLLSLDTVSKTPWPEDWPIARPLITKDNTNTE
jgi:hypothetical protein